MPGGVKGRYSSSVLQAKQIHQQPAQGVERAAIWQRHGEEGICL